MLERLQAQLRETLTGMDLILNTTRDAQRDLTAEERNQLDQFTVRAQELQADIQRIRSAESTRAAASMPAGQPTRPDVSGSNGQGQSQSGSEWRNFGEFLKAVHTATIDPRRTDPRLFEERATGMSEGVASDGGFLVQTDFRDTILEKVYNSGEIARRVKPLPIGPTANGIAIPMLDETSRATGSRWGGLRAYWSGEGATMTASKPTFNKFRLDLDKLTALVYVTDEELQDIPFLAGLLERLVPEELNFSLEDAVVNGSGAGMPLGILNAGCKVEVSKETGQAAATIVAENIVNMWSRLWARSMQNAVWLVNQDIFPQLYMMSMNVGTGGAPIFMPAGGLSGAPFSTLFNRPVLPVEYCQTLGTAGDIILADLNQYATIDKGGIQSASSIHVQFLTNETAYRFVYRVNGAPWWTAALTPKNGSNTQSPFVTLATRS